MPVPPGAAGGAVAGAAEVELPVANLLPNKPPDAAGAGAGAAMAVADVVAAVVGFAPNKELAPEAPACVVGAA